MDPPRERRLAGKADVAKGFEVIPAAASERLPAMVDFGRPTTADGPPVLARLPRPRPVELADLRVADRREARPSFRGTFDGGPEPLGFPGAPTRRPGHQPTLAWRLARPTEP